MTEAADQQTGGGKDRESRVRSAVVFYFPMLIAVLSLLTSIYNGWLNNRFVDIIQRNLGRAEYMRTCKEIIDGYFQVKFRVGIIAENAERERMRAAGANEVSSAMRDGTNAVSKVAALGTYLANLRDDATRVRYTEFSRQLEAIVSDARRTPPGELGKLFEPADRLFAALNDDCVNSAKAAPM